MSDLAHVREMMRSFTAERDWQSYHDPKSLILALTGEVGELAELFQWLPADEAVSRAGEEPLRSAASDELADVLLYLVRLADVLGVDLAHATAVKMEKNRSKHAAPLQGRHNDA